MRPEVAGVHFRAYWPPSERPSGPAVTLFGDPDIRGSDDNDYNDPRWRCGHAAQLEVHVRDCRRAFAPDELTARARRLLVRSSANAAIPETDELKLTRREGDVLRLLAQGLDQPAIAKALVISPKTVSSHIQHILGKLGVHSRAQAVAVAHRNGFLGGVSA
jgi:DNA-binding CsgD family transcriptional regulator